MIWLLAACAPKPWLGELPTAHGLDPVPPQRPPAAAWAPVTTTDSLGLVAVTGDAGGVIVAVVLPDGRGAEVLAEQVQGGLTDVEGWITRSEIDEGVLIVEAMGTTPRVPDLLGNILDVLSDPPLTDDELTVALRRRAGDAEAPVPREVRALATGLRDRGRMAVGVWGRFEAADFDGIIQAHTASWTGSIRRSTAQPDARDPVVIARVWTMDALDR